MAQAQPASPAGGGEDGGKRIMIVTAADRSGMKTTAHPWRKAAAGVQWTCTGSRDSSLIARQGWPTARIKVISYPREMSSRLAFAALNWNEPALVALTEPRALRRWVHDFRDIIK